MTERENAQASSVDQRRRSQRSLLAVRLLLVALYLVVALVAYGRPGGWVFLAVVGVLAGMAVRPYRTHAPFVVPLLGGLVAVAPVTGIVYAATAEYADQIAFVPLTVIVLTIMAVVLCPVVAAVLAERGF